LAHSSQVGRRGGSSSRFDGKEGRLASHLTSSASKQLYFVSESLEEEGLSEF